METRDWSHVRTPRKTRGPDSHDCSIRSEYSPFGRLSECCAKVMARPEYARPKLNAIVGISGWAFPRDPEFKISEIRRASLSGGRIFGALTDGGSPTPHAAANLSDGAGPFEENSQRRTLH